MDQALWEQLGTSESGLEKLREFESLTRKWTARINLIARSTLDQLWQRHIEDSARICLFAPKSPALWVDFGAGGGFPGIVAATIFSDLGKTTRFALVESDQRKAAFLREAARQLALPVQVLAERAESIAPLNADVVSARALAPLDRLCALLELHGSADGMGLFPKGEAWADEVAEARKNWSFDLVPQPDPGHKGAAFLELRNLRRAGRNASA